MECSRCNNFSYDLQEMSIFNKREREIYPLTLQNEELRLQSQKIGGYWPLAGQPNIETNTLIY